MPSALVLLLAVPSALASGAQPYDHGFSLTVSPLHLLSPIVEVTGEGRVGPKVGLAGIVGAGGASGVAAFELGAQGRYYPVGDFDHGMQVGAEVLTVMATASSGSTTATGLGISLGPFLGYKIAARFGLTFDAQLGVSYAAIQARGGGESESAAGVGPLLNLNLGWSF